MYTEGKTLHVPVIVHKARILYILRIRYAPREYYKRYANTLWAAQMRYANTIRDTRIRRANTISDMPIRYGSRECDMRIRYGPREHDSRYANTIRDTRIRYGKRECDMRYANKLRVARMRYAISEYATRYEQLQSGFLSHHSLVCCVYIRHARTHTGTVHFTSLRTCVRVRVFRILWQ